MTDQRLDTRQVRRAFARAASTYERHDALQREIESRLIDSLDYFEGQPQRVLDVGCGTGRGTALLKKRWRDAEVIALDLSLPMLRDAGDRKSTRLNSSHPSISYAVFCLKKKTKTNRTGSTRPVLRPPSSTA